MTAGIGSTTIEKIIRERGIKEVVHFTTNRGLTGILGSGLLKSRARLPQDQYLAEVLQLNCVVRKDPAWVDYVNMNITLINNAMFDYSVRQHIMDDVWWVVLAFKADILAHDDVVFTTTNNIYPAVRRAAGANGLAAMFAEQVLGRYSGEHRRWEGMPFHWPTDRQAEVLYHGEVSTAYLSTIYVCEPEHGDIVSGMLEVFNHPEVKVIYDSERFS